MEGGVAGDIVKMTRKLEREMTPGLGLVCHGPTCALASVCQSEIMIAKLGCSRHHMKDPPIMDDPIQSYLVVIS